MHTMGKLTWLYYELLQTQLLQAGGLLIMYEEISFLLERVNFYLSWL